MKYLEDEGQLFRFDYVSLENVRQAVGNGRKESSARLPSFVFTEGKSAYLGIFCVCGFSPLIFERPHFNCASELRSKTWHVFMTKVEYHLARTGTKSKKVELELSIFPNSFTWHGMN